MLVMAVEATRQLSDPTRSVMGYNIKNAVFQNWLPLGSDRQHVETHLSLRPTTGREFKKASKFIFRLCSLQNEWAENCHGEIEIHYKETRSDSLNERELFTSTQREKFNGLSDNCTETLDPVLLYQDLASRGFQYGAAFQLLQNVRVCHQGVAADVKLSPLNTPEIRNAESINVVHPTTLDCFLQLTSAMSSRGTEQSAQTAVPTRVDRLWISNDGLDSPQLEPLQAFSRKSEQLQTIHLMAQDRSSEQVRLIMEGLELTRVAGSENVPRDMGTPCRLAYRQVWKPDIASLSLSELQNFCGDFREHSRESDDFLDHLQFALLVSMKQALEAIATRPRTSFPPHLQKYISLMKLQVQFCDSNRESSLKGEQHLMQIVKWIRQSGAVGRVYAEVIENLISVLEGKVDPLDLLFSGTLLKEFYKGRADNMRLKAPLSRYMDILAHKKANMQILEVGAGTGGFTRAVIDILTSEKSLTSHGARFAKYCFTDISKSFFHDIQQEFQGLSSKMTFQALNIEIDPVAQGFEAGTYDLVAAAMVSGFLSSPTAHPDF